MPGRAHQMGAMQLLTPLDHSYHTKYQGELNSLNSEVTYTYLEKVYTFGLTVKLHRFMNMKVGVGLKLIIILVNRFICRFFFPIIRLIGF